MELIDTGLVIAKTPAIVVPASVGRAMLSIYNLLDNKNNEYGLYLKGFWAPGREGGPAVVVDPEAVYFPRQDVGSAYITFLEEPPDPTWNVVVHRHPPGHRSFSGVDANSINREFLASFLYLPVWEFPDAIINIPVADGVKIQVRAEVLVEGDMLEEMGSLREPTKSRINPPRPPVEPAPEEGPAAEAEVPVPGALRRLEVERTPAWPCVPVVGRAGATAGELSRIGEGLLAIPRNGTCELVE